MLHTNMNYLLATAFAVVGVTLLIWNKSLSDKFGAFYSRQFDVRFGQLANLFAWNDPNRPFNKFMYRGFIITGGIIFLIFAIGETTTGLVGSSKMKATSIAGVNVRGAFHLFCSARGRLWPIATIACAAQCMQPEKADLKCGAGHW
jgi:hypothetical protein